MTEDAPQAFLKFLEEPPPGTVVMLVLSGVRAMPATVISRCQIVRFGARDGDQAGEAVGEAWALLEAARAEGVPALFRRTDRLDRDRAEVLIDGCWLLCRDLLLVRAGAPAALLRRSGPRRDPRRRGPPLDRRRAGRRDRSACRAARRSADPQCDLAADGRDGGEPSAVASRLRIPMTEQIEEWLIGDPPARLRCRPTTSSSSRISAVTVGDIVLVETGSSTALGEIRRPRRAVPDFKRDRLFRRVVRIATDAEARGVSRPAPARGARDRHRSARGAQPRDADEGGGRRDVRSRAPGDRLLQRRGPPRLPRPGARPRPRVPGPRRDAAGRRPRHDARDGRHRPVRPPALLLVTSAGSSTRSR